jgi:hypothetical protein
MLDEEPDRSAVMLTDITDVFLRQIQAQIHIPLEVLQPCRAQFYQAPDKGQGRYAVMD